MTAHLSGKRIWGGSILLLTGLFYLLYNLNMLPFEVPDYVFTWQMAVVLTGVYLLYKNWFWGLVLILTGGYFLLPLTGTLPLLDFQKVWPVLLILMGLMILFGSGFKKKAKKKYNTMKTITEINEETFDITAVLGGETRQISAYDFKGGKITTVMGGVELDLTNCYLSKEGAVIDLSVVMGGVSLKISREWNIKSEIVPIMSGIEDEDLRSLDAHIDPSAVVILRGSVVMGGIEIKRA
ncbi:MAG TPA: DUF5668 domain-containing protein [Cytophagaceae bacterium]|jgi:predicted membrane protein|nr:DUF5668 domain-containing protein [Cytophagaceae bacterium]